MGTHRSGPTTPLWQTPHKKGFKIPTIEKHDIRVLNHQGKWSRKRIQREYALGQSIIRKVLFYPTSKRARPGRVGPKYMLSD